jgi:putative hydrolase of the HAD superfamily
MIAAAVFDLDDTIVIARSAWQRALATTAAAGVDKRAFRRASRRWAALYRQGTCTLDEGRIGRWLDCGLDRSAAEQAQRAFFKENAAVRLRPGARTLLSVLRRRGLRIGLLTNGPGDLQRAKLACATSSTARRSGSGASTAPSISPDSSWWDNPAPSAWPR